MTEVHLDPQAAPEPLGGPIAIGLELRRAREARGETPGDVALALKLTGRQVEAMEAGRLEQLPGAAFARGFLRNYARYLGLDPVALLAGLDIDVAARAVELAPMSNAEGTMPWGGGSRSVRIPAVLTGVALLMLVGGWYFDWFRVPQESETVAESVTPQIIAPAAPEASAGPAAPSMAAPVAAPVVPAPTVAAAAPTTVPVAPPSLVVVPSPTAPVPAPPPLTAPTPPAVAAAPAPRAQGVEQLTFRFEGDSWVEVRDASGSIVYSGLNQAGASRTVQGKPPFALVVGNARQVGLEYRGKPYDMLPYVRVSVARLTLE